MRIRTTHVGSLPRPAEMISRRLRKEPVGAEDMARYLRETVKRQLSIGLTYVNDGELPRPDYVSATLERIAGFGGTCTAPVPQDMEEVPEHSRKFSGRNGLITLNPKAHVSLPACTEELRYTGEAALRSQLDALTQAFMESRADAEEDAALFFTAPSPGTLALFFENHHYPDHQGYLERLGEVLKREYEIIAGYGVQLQIDCPDLAMGRHTVYKHESDLQFIDSIEANVAVLNAALAGVDPDRCRAHVCWGNYPGTHHSDVPLDTIFPTIMKLRPRMVSLESSNHRHAHEWTVLQRHRIPEDTVLMPGVIDTTSNTVEHPDLVAERLRRYTAVLGPDRVIACTDCGFATTAAATGVSGEVAWMKLASLAEGAGRASAGA